VLFHPLFLLNAGLFAILRFHPYFVSKFYDDQFYTLSMFIAVNTLIMPLLSVYLLKRFKFIDDFRISNPKQRLMPYAIIAMLLAFTTFQLYNNEFYGLPLVFLIATIVCVIFNILINIKFTISSHAIAAGGLIALFLYLTLVEHIAVFNWFLIGSVLAGGLSGWSRLYLNAHSERQVYAGYGLGMITVMVMLLVFA
jgi:hypothetical protein